MPMIPRRRKRPALRWARWLLLALGVALLGYVGFSFVDAQIYQAYEDWQLEKAIKVHAAKNPHSAATPSSAVTESSHDENARAMVALGDALGRLEISRIGVAAIIVEGITGRILRRAVGHIPGTALPGQPGNVAIAGHRDTFFRALSNIRQDDEVTLTTRDGSYRYRVDSMKVVPAEDTEVLNDSGESVLTLVTCYPFYFVGPAPKRFVVRAHQI